jgi:NAD(P)H-flavin reductase
MVFYLLRKTFAIVILYTMNQFNCRLIVRSPLTKDVSLYRFELETGVFSYSPGQFVSFVFTDPTTGVRLVRSYSIAGAHDPIEVTSVSEGCTLKSKMFELIIVHVTEGKGTTILKDLPVGSLLKAMGPAGNLTLKMTQDNNAPLVFCANSTGIAPFCAMVQYLARAKVYPEINIFWGLKTVQDVYLAEEFGVYEKMWRENGSRFTMKICLSREAALPEVAQGTFSHLALGRIQASVEQLPSKQYQFYICGGKTFVLDTKTFITAKYPDSTVYFERFN